MESISSRSFGEASAAGLLAPAKRGIQGESGASRRAGLLQRANAAVDTPDRSYWTAYDHFMVEREARAMRRAYVYAMIGKWRAAVRKCLLG